MAARYTHDYAAFDEHVLCAPWMVAHMAARAEKGKAFAEAHAPYDPTSTDGEHYRDRFRVESGVEEHASPSGRLSRRAYGRLLNDDPDAIYIEFGRHVDGRVVGRHRTLGSALEAMKE